MLSKTSSKGSYGPKTAYFSDFGKKIHNFAKKYPNGLEIYIVANNILLYIVVKFQVIPLRMHQVTT